MLWRVPYGRTVSFAQPFGLRPSCAVVDEQKAGEAAVNNDKEYGKVDKFHVIDPFNRFLDGKTHCRIVRLYSRPPKSLHES